MPVAGRVAVERTIAADCDLQPVAYLFEVLGHGTLSRFYFHSHP